MDQIASRQRHGQSLYKQNNYKAALAVFDNLIQEVGDPPISLLDNRAATYLKLKDFSKALKDGKRMINADKKDAAGYLRTAQILRLMERDEAALDIYKYGLKHMEKTCEGAKLLTGMRDKLVRRLASPDHVDPLQLLPIELVEMILSCLSFRELQQLKRISKNWKNVISNLASLYKHIDFSQARRNVPIKTLKSYISQGLRKTTHVTLHRANYESSEIFKFIAAKCPKLEYVYLITGQSNASLVSGLSMAPKLSTIKIGEAYPISIDAVGELLHRCKSLVRAEFHSISKPRTSHQWKGDFTTLRELVLDWRFDPCQENCILRWDLPGLVSKLLTLEKLEMGLCRFGDFSDGDGFILTRLHNLRHLKVAYDRLIPVEYLLCLPSTLAYLNIGSLDMRHAPGSLNDLKTHFTCLKSFCIGQVGLQNIGDFCTVLEANKGFLEELSCPSMLQSIDGPIDEEETSLISQGYLRGVKLLHLGGDPVTDETLQLIAEHCPSLRQVQLTGCRKMTGVGLKSLLSKQDSQLASIGLTLCEGVSFDAIEWGRSQGVKITITRPKDSKSLSRVRS